VYPATHEKATVGPPGDRVDAGTGSRSMYGEILAGSQGEMARRRSTTDERPGPLPEIHAERDNVTFALALDEIEKGARLVLRCDASGNVWVSIVPERELRRRRVS